MRSAQLCLPVELWPEVDRARWAAALAAAVFLEADKPAAHWSPARRRIVEQAYGQWICFLDNEAVLDPSQSPGERVTEERLQRFVQVLMERVAPITISMIVQALLHMLQSVEPEHDWTRLAAIHRRLQRSAKPGRNKLSRMAPASSLFDLGLHLMDTCEGASCRPYVATRFRDGLMIATLISCPLRLKNLTMITIGRHLTFDNGAYQLEFTKEETKTGRPYRASLPPQLTNYVNRYLELHRPTLRASSTCEASGSSSSGALWLNHRGQQLSGAGVRYQIEARTKEAFGAPIWPHLFRDCAVTELVNLAPEEIGIAPDLLGHTRFQTTQKHYIQAHGQQAHRAVQATLSEARAAARVRGNGKCRARKALGQAR